MHVFYFFAKVHVLIDLKLTHAKEKMKPARWKSGFLYCSLVILRFLSKSNVFAFKFQTYLRALPIHTIYFVFLLFLRIRRTHVLKFRFASWTVSPGQASRVIHPNPPATSIKTHSWVQWQEPRQRRYEIRWTRFKLYAISMRLVAHQLKQICWEPYINPQEDTKNGLEDRQLKTKKEDENKESACDEPSDYPATELLKHACATSDT